MTNVSLELIVTDRSGTSLLITSSSSSNSGMSALVPHHRSASGGGEEENDDVLFTFSYYDNEVIESIFPKMGWAAGGYDVSQPHAPFLKCLLCISILFICSVVSPHHHPPQVTIVGSGFMETAKLSCHFGGSLSTPALYLSPTAIRCTPTPSLASIMAAQGKLVDACT